MEKVMGDEFGEVKQTRGALKLNTFGFYHGADGMNLKQGSKFHICIFKERSVWCQLENESQRVMTQA